MADGESKLFDLSLNKGSAEDYSHSCDPCLTDGDNVEAHGYCIECQEYLCIVCYGLHSRSGASRDHHLLDQATSVPRNEPRSSEMSLTEKCSVHGEIIKFYCQKHEALACRDCTILDHKTCEIDYIPEKAVDFSKSKQCHDTLENLNSLHNYATDVQKIADKKTKEIDDTHSKNEKAIGQFQKEINDRIAELTRKCLNEAHTQKESKKQEISKVIKPCEKIAADINQVKLAATNSLQKNQDGQLFIAVKRAEQLLKSGEVKQADGKLCDIIPDNIFQLNKTIEIMFNAETVLGKRFSARTPDFLCRTVRPAAFSAKEKPVACVGIDFGSTCYGAGIQLAHESHKLKTFGKEPIAALFSTDQSLISSNFKATMELYSYEIGDCYFFESFMVELYRQTDANETYIEDVTGKKMAVVEILSTMIRSVKEPFIDKTKLRDHDIHWILTVPQRFHSAQQIMKKAAKDAGIQSQNLTVAFESEAAFAYIQNLTAEDFEGGCRTSVTQFPKGTKYIVLDAGGKIVTTTLYEVGNSKTTQLLHAALDSYGGNSVNEEWEAFLTELLGKDVMERKKKQNIHAYLEMMRTLNSRKHNFNEKGSYKVRMSFDPTFMTDEELQDITSRSEFLGKTRGGQLSIDAVLFKKFYTKSINAIISHLHFILNDETASGCEAIVMVGGFSGSSILCEAVQNAFPHVKVMVPKNPDSAVLSGSLIMGFS